MKLERVAAAAAKQWPLLYSTLLFKQISFQVCCVCFYIRDVVVIFVFCLFSVSKQNIFWQ